MCRPTPEILWFADVLDSVIESSPHYRLGENNRSLTIDSVQLADQRRYGCQATNTEGTTEPVYQQVNVAGQLYKLTILLLNIGQREKLNVVHRSRNVKNL